MDFKQMELKIKTQFSIDFSHMLVLAALTYLIIIILDNNYFIFSCYNLSQDVKLNFTLGKMFMSLVY